MDELCDEKKAQEPSHTRHDFRHPVMMSTLGNDNSIRNTLIMGFLLFKAMAHPDCDLRRVMRRGI